VLEGGAATVDDLLAELTGTGPAQPAYIPAQTTSYQPTPVRAPANDTDELDNVMNALQGMNTSSGQNKSFTPNVSLLFHFFFFLFFLALLSNFINNHNNSRLEKIATTCHLRKKE